MVPGTEINLYTFGKDMSDISLPMLNDEELLRHAYNNEPLSDLEQELASRLALALDYIRELEDTDG